ncbi:MAG: hypothetical protein AAGA35_04125 [Patescibacteria group bacterium]
MLNRYLMMSSIACITFWVLIAYLAPWVVVYIVATSAGIVLLAVLLYDLPAAVRALFGVFVCDNKRLPPGEYRLTGGPWSLW